MQAMHFKNFPWRKVSLVIFLVLFAGGVVAGVKEIRKKNEKAQIKKDTMEVYLQVAQACLKKFPAENKTQEIRNLRHCVVVNSTFSDDKNLKPVWDDKIGTAKWLHSRILNKAKEPPPMECSYRSGTLVGILRSLGYDAHDMVIPKNEDNFSDHVAVEVLNADTGKWEVHDASYDVDYVSTKNNARLSIKEMLTIDKDQYKPCNFKGKCGWKMETAEGHSLETNKAYWNIAYIKDRKVLYSTDRLDINAKRNVFGENISYCEWRKKWCNNIVELD